MHRRLPPRHHALLFVATLSAVALAPSAAAAFEDARVGTRLTARELPTLDGGTRAFVGTGAASVFVFFRPNNDFSKRGLRQVQALRDKLGDRRIDWALVVSDHYPRKDVRALVKELGLTIPVLIDKGDVLYGELGVKVHPTVGIADVAHVVRAYEPFRKINFAQRIEAHIQFVLGDIDEAALQRSLNPPAAIDNNDAQRARRYSNFAARLLAMGNLDGAVTQAEKSIGLDDTAAKPYALIAAAYARAGGCKQAVAYFAAARKRGDDETDPMLKVYIEEVTHTCTGW